MKKEYANRNGSHRRNDQHVKVACYEVPSIPHEERLTLKTDVYQDRKLYVGKCRFTGKDLSCATGVEPGYLLTDERKALGLPAIVVLR